MTQKQKRYTAMVIILAAIAVAVWRMSRPAPVTVTLTRVETGLVEDTVANTRAGTVKACRRAGLSPTVGGQIASLPVKEGDRVEADTLLLELWNDDLEAEVLLAERDERATKAKADEACVVADVAKREADRLTRLRSQGLASEEDADRAEGEAAATKAACRAARTLTDVSDARLDVARAVLERTVLRAPFTGTVAEINGELGEFVTPSPVGVPTPPAVDLVDTSCLYISAPIDEVDAPAIRAGMPARITMDAFPDTGFPGFVRRVAPYVLDIEKQARTVDIEAEISNATEIEQLLPGYSADVEVIIAVRENVLRIPTQAILDNNRVYVFDRETQTVHELQIQTGVANWEYTEVVEGLEKDRELILSVDRAGVEDGAAVVPE